MLAMMMCETAHGNAPKIGKLAVSHIVKEQKGRDPGDKLADVDHPAQDQRHLVALSKSRKKMGA